MYRPTGKAMPYPPYIPQLKIAITKALFFSGNISDIMPVAKGLQPDSPAAMIIRSTTKCQYFVTDPCKIIAMAKTIVQMDNIRTRLYLSAKTPITIPIMVKTKIKLGPASSW